MSFLKALFSGGDTVKAIGETVDKLFTSDDERLERKNEADKAQKVFDLEIAKLDAQALQNQTDVNKIEAASTSLFVSGARPFIMWGCGFAMLYSALFEPFMRFIAVVLFGYQGEFPHVDTSLTSQVLLGLLGLSTLRSVDKYNGVASK